MKICKYCKQPIRWTVAGWRHEDYFSCTYFIRSIGSVATPATIKEYYDAL